MSNVSIPTNESVVESVPVQTSIIDKIMPYAPYLVILAVVLSIGILAYLFLQNRNKLFKKDYDLENFKQKIKNLSKNAPKIHSNKHWIIGTTLFLSLILVAGIITALYFFEIIKIIPIVALIGIPLVITSIVIGLVFAVPSFFNSYNRIWTNTGELIGYQLSFPISTPTGFTEILFFKNMKFLFFKNIEILSIPTGKKISLPIPKKNEKGEFLKTTFTCDIPPEKRFFKNNDNDFIVNSAQFVRTRFFVYPLFANSDNVNFDEIVFFKEKYEGDLLNLSDIANATRENAIALIGSNPYVRIPNAQQQKESENE